MKRAAPLAALLLLVACPKNGDVKSGDQTMPPEVRKWAPPPEVVTYNRINCAGPLPLPDVPSRDEWVGPELEDGRLVYTVTTYDTRQDPPAELYKFKAFYGPEGFGYLGSWNKDVYTAWVPPEIVLPADPQVGQTWQAVHQQGTSTSDRSCEIVKSNLCDGGIVSVCDSKRDGGRIIMRDHFCPSIGWAGFEAMAVAGDNPPVRMWSEHLVRDGVAVKDTPEGDADTPDDQQGADDQQPPDQQAIPDDQPAETSDPMAPENQPQDHTMPLPAPAPTEQQAPAPR
jgi:hypothetical protein